MESYYKEGLQKDMRKTALDGREFHHCVHVMRHKAGDLVHLVDGEGGYYECRITDIGRQEAALEILENWQAEKSVRPSVSIGVALVKKATRFEFCIEKLVEIGVDRIIPLACSNSEKASLNHERLKHILISAMKQSERAWLPSLDEVTPFEQCVQYDFGENWKGIAMRTAESLPLLQYDLHGKDVVLLIGPEGDFTEEELSMARANGYHPVSFGQYRLRTETAAITAATIIQAIQDQ